MLWRFPHIGQEIFQQLNDQSISECREISQSWQEFINSEKFYKKRIKEMIEKHTKAYNDESVHYYCGGSTKETLTPLHSAALTGQFQMFKKIIQEDHSQGFLLHQLWIIDYYVKCSLNNLSNENITTGVSREMTIQK